VPLHGKRREIVERMRGTRNRNVFALDQPPQYLHDFDIDQMGGMKTFVRREGARTDSLCASGSEEELEQRGGVEDDQRRSRSARRTSVGDALPL